MHGRIGSYDLVPFVPNKCPKKFYTRSPLTAQLLAGHRKIQTNRSAYIISLYAPRKTPSDGCRTWTCERSRYAQSPARLPKSPTQISITFDTILGQVRQVSHTLWIPRCGHVHISETFLAYSSPSLGMYRNLPRCHISVLCAESLEVTIACVPLGLSRST